MKCYHDNNFIDASDIETKDRSQLIEEISVDSHGCGRTPSHLSDFPLDELQIIYQDILINKNLKNNVTKVKHPLQS